MRKFYKSFTDCKRKVRGWINLSLLFLVLGGVAGQAYGGVIVPVKLGGFNPSGIGAANVSDIVFNPDGQEYAILDSSDDMVYIVSKTGVLLDSFGTGASGCNDPYGIAYNSVTDQYLVTDYNDDEVYVFESDGTYDGQWDTSGFGATNPTGITYNSATNQYAICDGSGAEVYITNASGTRVDQFDTTIFGSGSPQGISYNPTLNVYAILDYSDDEVYIVDANTHALKDQFDTYSGIGGNYGTGITWISTSEVAVALNSIIYVADVSGKVLDRHDIGTNGCTDPTGIAFIHATQQVAITDSGKDEVYLFDAVTGDPVDNFDTAGFGSISPQGIAYNPRSSQLAIVDNNTDTVYLVNDSGTVASSFSIGKYGCTDPTGISYNYETNEYIISDYTSKLVLFFDTKGTLLRHFSTTRSSDTPHDIAYFMSSGNFAMPDRDDDEIYVINSAGKTEMSFDTYNFSVSDVRGIDYSRSTKRIYLVDASTDDFIVLDMPKVHQATTVTGSYTGKWNGVSCTLGLRMTDLQGFCGGSFASGGTTYDSPGKINLDKRKITLSLIPSSGASYQYQGTASADFNKITFPASSGLGTLTRVKTRNK